MFPCSRAIRLFDVYTQNGQANLFEVLTTNYVHNIIVPIEKVSFVIVNIYIKPPITVYHIEKRSISEIFCLL